MSNPRPESRIKSLEKRATTIEAAIEELADDTAEELRAIRQDIRKLDEGIKDSYVQIGGLFDRNFQSIEAIEGRLNRIESDISNIKVTMATKEDLRDCKKRVKSAISRPDSVNSLWRKDQVWKGSQDERAPKVCIAAHHSICYSRIAAFLENCHSGNDNLLRSEGGYDPLLTVS